MKKELTIISMSGGLDSATLCAEALVKGHDVFVLNFNYNQKNSVEMYAFDELIKSYKAKCESNFLYKGNIIGVKKLNLKPLFDEFLDIWADMRDSKKIKNESKHEFYTPSRNLLFSVIAAVIGEIIAIANDYETVNIGLGIHMHSKEAYGENKDYWDITPEFARKLRDLLELNDVKKMKLFAPFVILYKHEIVEKAKLYEVPIEKTWTCYNPKHIGQNYYAPCKKCEACIERKIAGEKAGMPDINNYSIKIEK